LLADFQHIINSKVSNLSDREIYLAISGGVDSVVLAHLLYKTGIKFTFLHCNFNLRKEESNDDEKFVVSLSEKLNQKCLTIKFDTLLESNIAKTNIQLTARNLRYNWFKKITQTDKNPIVLTGHHLDDNIETLLINLVRGTSIKGVAGIPQLRDIYFRPLLKFTKSQIINFALENNLNYRSDSSNTNTQYKRNLIRHEVIPSLEKINPLFRNNISQLLNDFTCLNKDLNSFSNTFKKEHFNYDSGIIAVKTSLLNKLSDLHLVNLFDQFNLHRSRVNEFRKFLLAKTGSKFIDNKYEFLINREELFFREKSEFNTIEKQQCNLLPYTFTAGYAKFKLSEITKKDVDLNTSSLYVDLNFIIFPINIRGFRKGERFQPYGMKRSSLISDILINKKISNFHKERVFLVADSNNLTLFLGEITSNNELRISEQTDRILKIEKIL
jgi:tRNA(Ile)-lysidine synthase